jgi:hypothetical protein
MSFPPQLDAIAATRTFGGQDALYTDSLSFIKSLSAAKASTVCATSMAYADVAANTAVEVPGLTMPAYIKLSCTIVTV